MSTITPLVNTDNWDVSYQKINTNIDNLNIGKVETSVYTASDVKAKYESNLDTNTYTDIEKSKLGWIDAWAQVNVPAPVNSVNWQTGVVVLWKTDVWLSNVDNTTDLLKPISTATQNALNNKQVAWTYASWTWSANWTNTGDVTLAWTPNYITIVGQVITRALINLSLHITWILPIANWWIWNSTLAWASIPTYTSTNTFTNKRITERVSTITSSITPTPNGDITDIFTITALAVWATIAAPTWTPTNWQKLIIRIKDNATAQTLAWNAIYRAWDVALPTTTIISKTMYVWFIYNSNDIKWDLVAFLDNL